MLGYPRQLKEMQVRSISLPTELVDQVCTFLQPRDLKALRLACRELECIASKHLLETVYLDLLPDSFDRLLSVSAHPTLSRYVRTIFYVPVRFFSCTSLDDFRECCHNTLLDELSDRRGLDYPEDLSLSDERWLDHYNNHETHCRMQQQLLESSTIESVLYQAFTSFPKLDTLVMVDFFTSTSTDFGRTFYTSPMQKALKQTLLGTCKEPTGLLARHPYSLLLAASSAGIKPKEIALRFFEQTFFDLATSNPAYTQSVLDRLQILRINMPLSQDPDDGWVSRFVLFLRSCPSLQKVELVFNGERAVPWMILGSHLPWLELRSLWLRGIALLEDEMVDFVANHQPALSRILLTDCPLETGSWSSLHNRVKAFFPGSFQGSNEHASYFVHHPPNPFSSV
jgi:hypothetical protein